MTDRNIKCITSESTSGTLMKTITSPLSITVCKITTSTHISKLMMDTMANGKVLSMKCPSIMSTIIGTESTAIMLILSRTIKQCRLPSIILLVIKRVFCPTTPSSLIMLQAERATWSCLLLVLFSKISTRMISNTCSWTYLVI